MTCDEPVFIDSQSVDRDVCMTNRVVCHTFLSYKMGVLSYNCMTFRGFCHTFLSYKMGVLSYNIQWRILTRQIIPNRQILWLINEPTHINIMILRWKKGNYVIFESVLSYIVIHFYSEHILILFSSSFCYYYYYDYYYYYY